MLRTWKRRSECSQSLRWQEGGTVESVGAHLLVFGLLWVTLIDGGTLLVKNHWGVLARLGPRRGDMEAEYG